MLGGTTISLEQQALIDEVVLKVQPSFDVDLNMGVDKRLVQTNNLPLIQHD